jgi:hypothetical protein
MRWVDDRALVEEAGKASAVLWIRLPERAQPLGAWYAWVDGAVVVIHEGGEQSLPGLQSAAQVDLLMRSKDKGSLLLTAPARVEPLQPSTEPYERAVNALHTARQSVPDSDPLRWAAGSQVTRLEPAGPVAEGPGSYDPSDRRAVPVETDATTLRRLPLVLGRRSRRRPKL